MEASRRQAEQARSVTIAEMEASIRVAQQARATREANVEARKREEQQARAIEIGKLQARRRNSEGLAMRPHPGNQLEPAVPAYKGYGSFGDEGSCSYAGEKELGANNCKYEKEQRGSEGGASSREEQDAEKPDGGGYKIPEYEPVEYDVKEYKSIYEK